jgi:subtilase family serine protease
MIRARALSLVAAVVSLGYGVIVMAASEKGGPVGDTIIRQADDSENVHFALTLPLQNQSDLDQALKGMYNPKSPNFRHFLSSTEFNSKYAPSESAYAALKSFAASSGLSVTAEHAGRTLVEVSGSVATIRNLFKAQMYWHQTGAGQQYVARDTEGSAPSALSLIGGSVTGLNHKPAKPFIAFVPSKSGATPNAGTGPIGSTSGDSPSYEPADIKTAYNLNSIQNGGQPVALIELSAANYADAQTYATKFNLNNPVPLSNQAQWLIPVSGGTTAVGQADEVMLDIEMVMAVSNTNLIYLYTAPNSVSSFLPVYTAIADGNLVGQVSTSWGVCEADLTQSEATSENDQFKKMAAQGMAVFAASGDFYAYDCATSTLAVDDPASQPYVTGVGGTTLTTTSGQSYAAESAWYDAAPSGAGYNGFWGGGGGVSTFCSIPSCIPSYQTGFTPTDSQYSTTNRNVPDVALNADPYTGYYIYCTSTVCSHYPGYSNGWIPNVGGTSAAAPQWAATWSLISKGLGTRAGFANPTIYSIAKNATTYASSFHDVPSGSGNGYFNTFSGFDNATGWGSYNGGNLYSAVVAPRRAAILAPIIDLLLLQ